MTQTRFIILIFLSVALLSTGCNANRSEEHAAPAGSTVKILATSPDHSETLMVGDVVKLEAEVEYRLNADSGTLSLVIQESDTTSISVFTEVVTRGNGTTVFEAEFVVPDTKSVVLFTPLTVQSQTKTSTVDTLAFKVEADDSEEIDLGEAALIDADYCAISGVAVGSTYHDVLSVFGQPIEESEIGGGAVASRASGRTLNFEGVFVGLKEGSVIIVSSERAEHGVHGGLRPTSMREEIVQTLGETVGMSGDSREVLAYRCRDSKFPDGEAMVAVVVAAGIVESISVVLDTGD